MKQSRRAGSESKTATTTVRIPEDVYTRVRVIAGVTGTTPGGLLSKAFAEYFRNHRKDFAHHFELAQNMIFSGDVDSIMEATKPARSRRAESAAKGLGRASMPETRLNLSSLREHREAILELAAKNGAKRVRVFGSVSRGEAGEDSDVDFLVELDEDRSLLDHSRLILDLEELLGRRVHVVTPGSVHKLIRDRIMAEAQSL